MCLAENKVQELCDKYEQLPKNLHWHLIGHLQRNKVKYIVGKTDLIILLTRCDWQRRSAKKQRKKEQTSGF